MISTPDRRQTIALINRARHDGARLVPACQMAGISARTYQRWTATGPVCGDRRPTTKRPAPANKLTPKERQRVLTICHQPEYASLPPGQIVPRLADQGEYVASESRFKGQSVIDLVFEFGIGVDAEPFLKEHAFEQ